MDPCTGWNLFVLLSMALVLFGFTPTSHSIPYVFFHGLGGKCANSLSTTAIAYLSENAGVQGQCIEIADENWSSNSQSPLLEPPLEEQIQLACAKIKELEHLKDGYNIFGVSQGTIIGRGVIEFCDDAPPVRNFISLAGPQAGVATLPYCIVIFGSKVCSDIDSYIYQPDYQAKFTASSYYKSPLKIEEYLKNSIFLPKLNNERAEERNSTYKDRFTSLEKLVLIMSEGDTVVNPKESAWFGYYEDGNRDIILPANQTKLYIEDWFGLKTLTESGRVIKHIAPGSHANLDPETVLSKYVLPYLLDDNEAKEKGHAFA